VPIPSPTHRHIVVGVDGGPSGEHALRWALSAEAFAGHLVHAVLVMDPSPAPIGGLDGLCVLPDDGEQDEFTAVARLERSIGRAVHGTDRDRVRPRVVRGGVATQLATVSAGADLLVVGRSESRGRHLLGPTRQLLFRAACPVVVVPRTTPVHRPALAARLAARTPIAVNA